MDIRAALDAVVTLQSGLAISSPVETYVKRAWKYIAPQEALITESPCWMNTWTMVSEERGMSQRRQEYTIHMVLFVEDADRERAADIATAFHVELVDALDASIHLGGATTKQSLRGADPTLETLVWAGRSYMGLSLFLDLVFEEGKEFAA